MKRFMAYGLLAVPVVLSGCADNAGVVAPTDDRVKWGWDRGLATGWGGPPQLICTPTLVPFNGTVSCVFANGGPMALPTWRFDGPGGLDVPGPLISGGWSGNMVISGDVVVDYVDPNLGPQQLRKTVVVARRTWSWASSVGGQQGAQGEIDDCFEDWEEFGLTASKNCTVQTVANFFTPTAVSNGNGYVAASVPGSGPNGGLFYVASVSADMDLRTQVKKDFRVDADSFSMTGSAVVINGCAAAFPSAPTLPRTTHTVNTTCVPTAAFGSMVSCSWGHEAKHLTAATISAQTPSNDVYKTLEPMVEKFQNTLHSRIDIAYSGAKNRVLFDALDAHESMTLVLFQFWYNTGGGWQNNPGFNLLC